MPNDTKTWTVAGTSVQRGERTLRFANGRAEDRKRILEKCGCTDVRLWDLPCPMTREAATAWLAERGDEIPVPAPRVEKPARQERPVREARPVRQERATRRAAQEMIEEATELAHEELGRARYMAPGNMRVLTWDECSIEVRQEFCRNAAREAGLPTPRGTFPQLERWLEQDGVRVQEDGTLVE